MTSAGAYHMTALESPCYLCQQRTLGCHSRCKDYIAFAQSRQEINEAKHTDTGLQAYSSDRYFKIQRRLRHGCK